MGALRGKSLGTGFSTPASGYSYAGEHTTVSTVGREPGKEAVVEDPEKVMGQ